MKILIKRILINLLNFVLRKNIKIRNSNLHIPSIFTVIKSSKTFPVRIYNSTLGNGFSCEEGCLIENSILYGKIKLGRFVSLNGGIYSSNIEGIEIGSFSSLAPNVMFFEHIHRMDKISTYFMNSNIFRGSLEKDIYTKGKIVLEEDVWIGANATVLSGVRIGRGSVIGAGCIVSKDIPPYSIVAGNPMKIIKKRFPEQIIEELEKSQWWLWSIKDIIEKKDKFNINLLSNNDPIFN